MSIGLSVPNCYLSVPFLRKSGCSMRIIASPAAAMAAKRAQSKDLNVIHTQIMRALYPSYRVQPLLAEKPTTGAFRFKAWPPNSTSYGLLENEVWT